jgi:hypothetical protein
MDLRRTSALVLWIVGCAPAPGVTPAAGRGSGGEPLRIIGAGFRSHGAPVVYVGPKAAKAVVVESDQLITVLTPEADGPGLFDVSVRFSDGEVVEYPAAFTYGDRAVVLQPRDPEG